MIYLDSAATTLNKPSSVGAAVKKAVNSLATPGRGGHSASMLAAETAFLCRSAAAKLFGVENPENIIFTFNATHGLNIAIKTLAGPGDRVVVSGYEHNSVVRPLKAIGAQIVVAGKALFEPEMAVHSFENRLTPDTKLVICNHVSNVFGYILPLERISDLCRERGIPLIVDASQSAGTLELNAKKLKARFIAMPGHKGLYGPQGTGILICGGFPKTLIEGGTGGDSISREMPEYLPDRLEAGTHNMPGIAGLAEGLRFVEQRGTSAILGHEQMLLKRAAGGLEKMTGVQIFASRHQHCQAGVLSFNLRGVDAEMVAEKLKSRDIAVRAGLHCAPLAHESCGTLSTGTVRISFSVFTTRHEVDRFLNIIEHIAKKMRK